MSCSNNQLKKYQLEVRLSSADVLSSSLILSHHLLLFPADSGNVQRENWKINCHRYQMLYWKILYQH